MNLSPLHGIRPSEVSPCLTLTVWVSSVRPDNCLYVCSVKKLLHKFTFYLSDFLCLKNAYSLMLLDIFALSCPICRFRFIRRRRDCKQTKRQTDIWTERETDRQTDRRMYIQIDRWIDGHS